MHQGPPRFGSLPQQLGQVSGHKSLKSLDSYAVASREQQRQMSKILIGKENNSKPKPKPNALKENIHAHSSSSNVLGSMPTSSLFSGVSIGVLNIQNLVLPEASSSNRALGISAQKKRRRHVIESMNLEQNPAWRARWSHLARSGLPYPLFLRVYGPRLRLGP